MSQKNYTGRCTDCLKKMTMVCLLSLCIISYKAMNTYRSNKTWLTYEVVQVFGRCRLGTAYPSKKTEGVVDLHSVIDFYRLCHRKTFICFSFFYWYFGNQWELSLLMYAMYLLVANFAYSAFYVTISENTQDWVIWNHHFEKVSHRRD